MLLQGERDTNELNDKLAQFSENAMKFTMDGGLSAYDYKAEEDEPNLDLDIKSIAGEQPFTVPNSVPSVPYAFSPVPVRILHMLWT